MFSIQLIITVMPCMLRANLGNKQSLSLKARLQEDRLAGRIPVRQRPVR